MSPKNNNNGNRIPRQTKRGRETVRDSSNRDLSRALRNLLIMVDGFTPVSQYRMRLKNYAAARSLGGVTSMLGELEILGLVEFDDESVGRNDEAENEEAITIESAITVNPDDFVNEEEFLQHLPPFQPDRDLLGNLKLRLQDLVGGCAHPDAENFAGEIEEVETLADYVKVIRDVWKALRSDFSRSQRQQIQVLYKVARLSV